jgi:nucleotide-binding universal stress UspA family protein
MYLRRLKMFERVFTATDMLTACDAAVIAALEIAQQNKGKLFVLHVLEPSYFHECGPVETVKDFKTGKETSATQEYKELVKQELDKKCSGALKPYGNYQIDISYGKPSIEIRRWSNKIGAELVVLGPHAGQAKEEEELIGLPIGNTVEDVLSHTTAPVMIINRLIPKEKLNFKKILVCVDFSKSCKYACQFAAKLAKQYGSKLFFFHMSSNKDTQQGTTAKERMKEFCEIPEGIECELTSWGGMLPHTEILRYANELDVNLIVMGSRTKEAEKRVYIGSAVEHVSSASSCPVVVITHPDALAKLH